MIGLAIQIELTNDVAVQRTRYADAHTSPAFAEMTPHPTLPPKLSAFEFESLRQIAAHPASHHVPSRVQSRLKDIGYVRSAWQPHFN
jgi:hypothetical protein